MTTEELLKKNGIIRHKGKLIYCEKNHYFYRGVPYPSLLKVEQKIDKEIERQTNFLKNVKIIDLRNKD